MYQPGGGGKTAGTPCPKNPAGLSPGNWGVVSNVFAVPTVSVVPADKIAADKIAADKIAADRIAADRIAVDEIAIDCSPQGQGGTGYG